MRDRWQAAAGQEDPHQEALVKARGRQWRPGPAATLLAGALSLALSACGWSAPARTTAGGQGTSLPAALVAGARPIGRAPLFEPRVTGPFPGPCRAGLGPRFGVHVELFARNRVMLVAAGIGARSPLHRSEGRIDRAACFGDLVTLEPTGVVLLRPASSLRLSALFRAWGQPLSHHRLASFSAGPGKHVAVYVDGVAWNRAPGEVPLRRHAEIVLEVGPHVPPHGHYNFPPGS